MVAGAAVLPTCYYQSISAMEVIMSEEYRSIMPTPATPIPPRKAWRAACKRESAACRHGYWHCVSGLCRLGCLPKPWRYVPDSLPQRNGGRYCAFNINIANLYTDVGLV